MRESFWSPQESWIRYLLRFLLLAIGCYMLWRVQLALVILLLGGLLAYALRPLVITFERIHIGKWQLRRGLSVTITFIIVAAVIVGLFLTLIPPLNVQIKDLIANLPSHEQSLNALWKSTHEFYQRNFPDNVRVAIDKSLAETTTFAQQRVEHIVGATFRGIGIVIELFLVPILAAYFLADSESLRRQVVFFFPPRSQPALMRTLDGFHDIMYRYVVGQLALCFMAFAVVSAALLIMGNPFWLLLGIIAGITRAVPVIGPLLGGIPVVASVLAQSQSVPFGLWVTIGFTLLHLFESKYLMPAILGHQLRLHPVLIIFSLLAGAELFGLLGMFIAVPVLAGIRFLIADYRAHTDISDAELTTLKTVEET